jgi:hypothetical protein
MGNEVRKTSYQQVMKDLITNVNAGVENTHNHLVFTIGHTLDENKNRMVLAKISIGSKDLFYRDVAVSENYPIMYENWEEIITERACANILLDIIKKAVS